MKRLLAVVLCLLALVLAGFIGLTFLEDDAGPALAPPPEPPAPLVPEVLKGEPPPPRKQPEAVVAPSVSPWIVRGRVEGRVSATGVKGFDNPPRLTVLLVTGEVVANVTANADGRYAFGDLPVKVPLVLRVEADGFLTGYCCDVEPTGTRPLRKDVQMARAPRVNLRVVRRPHVSGVAGVHVEILRAGAVVAEGVTTDRSGEVSIAVPVVGHLEVRARETGQGPQSTTLLEVWPGDDPAVRDVELFSAGTLEFAVMKPSGDPAPGVAVWLVGGFPRSLSARTDSEGVASFAGVRTGSDVIALARGSDGNVAWASLRFEQDSRQRVPLLLGEPGVLTGDVVDEGNSPIRDAEVSVVVKPFDEAVKVRTNEVGEFVTPPLPAGLAHVVVRRVGYDAWRSEHTVEVKPRVGAQLRARMHARPTGRTYVVVRDEAGNPVAGATVRLMPSMLSATTGKDGFASIDGVPAGVEQSVFARRRGLRPRRDALTQPVTIRVGAFKSESAQVFLVAATGDAKSSEGPVTVQGTLHDPAGDAVVGVRVQAGGVSSLSSAGGGFRLDSVMLPGAGEPVEVLATPARGLLEPLRLYLDPDEHGVVDLGTIRMKARPYARIELPSARRSPSRKGDDDRVVSSWLSSSHADEFLGERSGRFQPVACVSYDGTWIVLPPADDWAVEGRAEVFVADATPRGLVTARAEWTLAPDAAATLRPAWEATPGRFSLRFPDGSQRAGRAVLTQIACATLYDPRSIHVPTGETLPLVDPFADLVTRRAFETELKGKSPRIDDVAPGRWRVELREKGESAKFSADVLVPADDTATFSR